MSSEQQPTTTAAPKGAKSGALSAEAQRAKANYKKTKLGWIPENWEVKKVSDTFSFLRNTSHARADLTNNPKEGNIGYIHYGDIHATYTMSVVDCAGLSAIPKLKHEAALPNKVDYMIDGDVILADASEDLEGVGKCVELKGIGHHKVISGLHTHALRDAKGMTAPLFRNLLFQGQAVRRQFERLATGSKVSSLSKGDLKAVLLPLPPLPEQHRIAAILGTWDRAITTVQQLLAAQQKRKRGLMQELLSGKRRFEGFEGEWRTVRLGDLGETYTGLTGKTATDFGEGAPYIPYLNIFNNSRIDPRQVDRVRVGTNDRQNRVRRGDIFFTVSSETPDEVGMAAVLLDEVEEMYLNSFCFGFRLNTFDQLLPEFARYYLRGTTFRRALNKLAQGATRYNLSKGQLVNLHLHLPGIKEQQAIADCLESIDREIDALNRYTARLAAQKRGLMQQLLTGRVRVTTEA